MNAFTIHFATINTVTLTVDGSTKYNLQYTLLLLILLFTNTE